MPFVPSKFSPIFSTNECPIKENHSWNYGSISGIEDFHSFDQILICELHTCHRSPKYSVKNIRSPKYSVENFRSPKYSVENIRSPKHSMENIRSPKYSVKIFTTQIFSGKYQITQIFSEKFKCMIFVKYWRCELSSPPPSAPTPFSLPPLRATTLTWQLQSEVGEKDPVGRVQILSLPPHSMPQLNSPKTSQFALMPESRMRELIVILTGS